MRSPHGHHGHLARRPVVSGIPAYAGTAVTELTPGTISNPTAAFAHRRCLLGAGRVHERVTGDQPDDAQPALGLLDDDLGARGVGERLAVLAEATVDDLGARCLGRLLVLDRVDVLDGAAHVGDEGDVLGAFRDEHVSVLDQPERAHGQQLRVTGAGADERHATGVVRGP